MAFDPVSVVVETSQVGAYRQVQIAAVVVFIVAHVRKSTALRRYDCSVVVLTITALHFTHFVQKATKFSTEVVYNKIDDETNIHSTTISSAMAGRPRKSCFVFD